MFSRGIRRGSTQSHGGAIQRVWIKPQRWKTSGFFRILSHRATLEVECTRRRIGRGGFSEEKLNF